MWRLRLEGSRVCELQKAVAPASRAAIGSHCGPGNVLVAAVVGTVDTVQETVTVEGIAGGGSHSEKRGGGTVTVRRVEEGQ